MLLAYHYSMFYTYILFSFHSNKLYAGFTQNLRSRLSDHVEGRGGWTKLHRPLKLIYYEAHLSKVDAIRREKYFKTDKGKSTLKLMLRNTLIPLTKIKF